MLHRELGGEELASKKRTLETMEVTDPGALGRPQSGAGPPKETPSPYHHPPLAPAMAPWTV